MPDTIVPRSIFSPEVPPANDHAGSLDIKASHARNRTWFADNIANMSKRGLTPDRVLREVQSLYEIYTVTERRIAARPYV